ncbi:dual specificity mitogen-activated protein kinase kinase 6-like isoform X1 [Dysidea avara]|uniref:dual specificity mitogen-activated protein kinase kinase 6-like isoform X1 n=1 Tax=Dysidea avara TaxID=196820 RepID=UPI00332F8C70
MAGARPKFNFNAKPKEEEPKKELEHNDHPITSTGTFIIEEKKFEVKATDLLQLKERGRGAFGVVYEMQHRDSGTIMAVKRIRATADGNERKYLMRDLNIIEKSKGCPYIVTFYGVLLKDGDLWICMELMDNSLDKVYKLVYHDMKKSFPEKIIGKMAVAILKALHFLVEVLHVMHRDVKPSNVLISNEGQIKMCDFGIAGVTTDSNKCYTRGIGCKVYMPPERVLPPPNQKKGYDSRSDVWSFGCTLFELATGKAPYPPWQTVFDQLKSVVEGPPPNINDTDLSNECKEFTHLCLEKDVNVRPNYVELLKHQFILTSDAEDTDVGTWYHSVREEAKTLGLN